MYEKQREDTRAKTGKSGIGTILTSVLYLVTVIMIMAYLYQSFTAYF